MISVYRVASSCFLIVLLLVLPVAFGQTLPKRRPVPQYEISELPLRPLSISNSGWIAGITDDQHAATWSLQAGLFRVPLPLDFTFSECVSINASGEAVGTASAGDYSRRIAFVVRQNKVSFLPGTQSRANSISERGEIVGQTIFPDSKAAQPVLWKNGALIDLHICCAGSARSINSRDLIAGDTYDKEGRYHAFLWDAKRGARLLTLPGEQYSTAMALNSRGQVVLKSTPRGLFLYSHGVSQPIDIPKATPRAMSKEAVLVGSYGPNPEQQRAFVWNKANGLQDLNSLIPQDSGWTLEVASSINDRGEIVGWGDHGGVENAGFILRPRAMQQNGPKHKPDSSQLPE